MSQISPPMRILLAGAVVFLALWFTVLRPKPAEVDAPPATPAGNVNTGQPAQSTAGKIVEKAKSAATQAAGAAKAAAGETSKDETKTGSGSAAVTAPKTESDAVAGVSPEQLAKLPKDVAAAIRDQKVLVFAVLADKGKHWRPMADDDRYVRNTLKHVNRYDGGVFVKQVPLAKIASYGPIVNDLKINQTPSVVVVDAKLKASVLEGYLDRVSINQAIADAHDASASPRIKASYLRSANKICENAEVSFDRWSNPTVSGKKATIASMERYSAENRAYQAAVRDLAAPKRWAGLRKQWLKVVALDQGVLDDALKAAKSHSTGASAIDAWNAFGITTGHRKEVRKLDARFNDAGLTACALNRSK